MTFTDKLLQKAFRCGRTICPFPFLDQGQEFIIFSYGCLDLSASILICDKGLVSDIKFQLRPIQTTGVSKSVFWGQKVYLF